MLVTMKVSSWHPRFKALARDQVDLLHASGTSVFPWTIKHPRRGGKSPRPGRRRHQLQRNADHEGTLKLALGLAGFDRGVIRYRI